MKKYTKNEKAIASLDANQYRITQESGTEASGSGKLLNNYEPGIYIDIVSSEPLFPS